MLVMLILILLLVWAAAVWTIYSGFSIFYSNFSETENYHRAYYASISALERWELAVKQHEPWYIWSGGFINWVWTWSRQNWWSDKNLSWFSYLWNNAKDTTVFWTVNSRTNRIPAISGWDVEPMLSATDSSNYNKMDYENAEVFLLYYDKSTNPYGQASIQKSSVSSITWIIRLPALLSSKFWKLDTNKALVWLSGSLPPDDAIVDWQIRWEYNNTPFTVYSTQGIAFGGNTPKVDAKKDTVFRESDINEPLKFEFKKKNPIKNPTSRGSNISELTVISQNENIIKSLDFSTIFGYNSGQLRFALLNLLQWTWNNIYPFLEYYVDFGNNAIVPDKYYTINAEWEYKDFKVNTIIKKPTVKESILWSFTSIF